VEGISVRDSSSKEQLVALGVQEDQIHLTADPAFGLSAPDEPVGLPSHKPLIGVVWRSCEPFIPSDAQRLLTVYTAQALNQLAQAIDAGVVIFSFHPTMDAASCRELAQCLRGEPGSVPVHLAGDLGFHQQFALLAHMDLLLAVR